MSETWRSLFEVNSLLQKQCFLPADKSNPTDKELLHLLGAFPTVGDFL
ncbi:hypothetical protein HUU39_20875 [candidate division KSB1 bacterium]|nr:hypothetical protein [bacterium]NUM67688.1 hypothetical protein [candidate division KSB1 bacterium]